MLWTVLSLIALFASNLRAVDPQDYAVQLTAEVSSEPAQVILHWPPSKFATAYTISRKLAYEQTWTPLASLSGTSSNYVDGSVVVGGAYEYEAAQTANDGITAYGYIYAGMEVSFESDRGRVVLIVESSVADALASELALLAQDLVGDGWTVLRHDVPHTVLPQAVKETIETDYRADPIDTKAVFLIGHIAVPYSGDINPDLHQNHMGAWPADAFYGDMTGTWTDATVNDSSAEDPRNFNVPNDGKFDQSVLPAMVVLQVGRVDLNDLPSFSPKTEIDLLRQYLNKDHSFRHRILNFNRRGLIRDNFGDINGDAPATDAWRTFAPFFGTQNISAIGPGTFFSTLNSASYLWAYGGGGGEYYQADGVGSTADFASHKPQCVFFMLDGSYFGDWDSTDNFLRAALASPGDGLIAAWTGLPHWFLHHMALGETIGYSTLITQNNRGVYKNQINLGAGQVHIALMGDPTLRMHTVAPPSNVTTQESGSQSVTVFWSPSSDSVKGYYVYRASSPGGPFARLTRSFISGTSFIDTSAPPGPKTYMVRAIKLENSSSGTFYNPSQGIFTEIDSGGGQTFPISISPIPDQSTSENMATLPIPFTIINAATTNNWSVSADSSDSDLVSTNDLRLTGSSTNWSLIISPATNRTGTVTITVRVSDDLTNASVSFKLVIVGSNRIESVSRRSDGAAQIEFEGTPGRSYEVEASRDLLNWTPLSSGVFGTDPAVNFLDDQASTNIWRFYRISWK